MECPTSADLFASGIRGIAPPAVWLIGFQTFYHTCLLMLRSSDKMRRQCPCFRILTIVGMSQKVSISVTHIPSRRSFRFIALVLRLTFLSLFLGMSGYLPLLTFTKVCYIAPLRTVSYQHTVQYTKGQLSPSLFEAT